MQSGEDLPRSFTDTLRAEDYEAQFILKKENELLAQLPRDVRWLCAVAGTETGVLAADRLAVALGLPANRPELSLARRDKFEMGEAVRRAGLRAIRQCRASSPEEILTWARAHGLAELVLKPLSSAGTDAEQANPSQNFTVSPLNLTDGSDAYWVLPAYTHARAQFTAHVHYRNAQGQDSDALPRVHVVVRDVAVDQLLKTPFTRPANLTYTYVESADGGYLVHKLAWDPDFNQILRVRPIAEAQGCLQRGGAELTVTGVAEGEANRLRAGQAPVHAIVCGQSVTVTATGELFEFKADLEH